jgi:hypothetical protein
MSTDDQDRLSFGEGPLGGPLPGPDADADADVSPRRSRAFVYIAVAMAGLILLGILALVAALTLWLPAQRGRQIAAVTATVSALTREAAAWTATPAPTATLMPPTATPTEAPTQTPAPTATSTRVVSDDRTLATATYTPTPRTSTGDGTIPPAGLGTAGMAAIAVGLTGLLLVARKLRGQG